MPTIMMKPMCSSRVDRSSSYRAGVALARWMSALAVFCLALTNAAAQTRQPDAPSRAPNVEAARRVAVTVALVESLPVRDASALILRRPHEEDRDVILLPARTANGERLASAAFTLLIARDRAGDTAAVASMLPVREDARGQPLGDAMARYLDVTVARLRAAPRRAVAGVGHVPAVSVYLPSRAMRNAMRGVGRFRTR